MRTGAVRYSALVAIGLATLSCEDLLLTDPAPGTVALVVSPRLAGSPAAQAGQALVVEKADELRVTFTPLPQGPSFTEAVPLTFQNGEARARIEVEPDGEEPVAYRLDFEILYQGRPLFAALEPSVTLVPGTTTGVTPTLDPEVGEVVVQPVATITALGEEVAIQAAAFFTSGDPLPGALLTYTSLNPAVLSRVGGGTSNTFRAESEGTTQVVVSAIAGSLEIDPTVNSGSTDVVVAAEATTLEALPTSLELEPLESAGIVVTARDSRGNILNRTIGFESTDTDVVTVSSTGPGSAQVTAGAEGEAAIEATLGSLSVSVPVVVEAEVVELVAEPTSLLLEIEEAAIVTVTALDAQGNPLPRTIAFESTNEAVAAVASTGPGTAQVTGLSEGDADIVASLGALSVTIPVRVREEPQGVERTVTYDDLEQFNEYPALERSGVIASGIAPGVLTVVPDPSGLHANAIGSCNLGSCPYQMRLDFTEPAQALRLVLVGDDEMSTVVADVTTSQGMVQVVFVVDGEFESADFWDLSQLADVESVLFTWNDPAGMGLSEITFVSTAPVGGPAPAAVAGAGGAPATLIGPGR